MCTVPSMLNLLSSDFWTFLVVIHVLSDTQVWFSWKWNSRIWSLMDVEVLLTLKFIWVQLLLDFQFKNCILFSKSTLICRTSRKSWNYMCTLCLLLMFPRILHSYCYASVQVTYGVLDICNWIRAPCSHLKVWKTIAFSSGNIYFCFGLANSFSNGL